MVVESMDITIEVSDTLARICRDANLTPKELIEGYIASLTLLHSTYERIKNEGTERRSFSEILSKLYQQILGCTPSNLDVAPSLIEQTNKLVGINQSIGASIINLLIDYDNRTVSYNLHYTLCSDAAQLFAYRNLALGIRITPKYVQVSHLDYIPLLDDINIYNADLEILNDFVNQRLLRGYNDTGKEDTKIVSDPNEPFIQVTCTLSLVGSNPYQAWNKTRSQSHEFFLIKIDVRADKVTQLLPIVELASINRDIRGLAVSEFGMNI
ncbi:MAG: hypothetical protein GEU26_06405 [Nitrososphaeraceae archaeon]|nr:hypothetical protein [Nitrososphaeraceae archaeon]